MKAGGTPKFKYKRVKIIWQDIITDASWFDSLEDVDRLTFQWCEDVGYLYSKDISTYSFVEVRWLDIEGDDGWSTLEVLQKEKLPVAVSKGYLLSQEKGVTRLFRDYIENKEKDTMEDIGSTVIIPTSVIISIKKIKGV